MNNTTNNNANGMITHEITEAQASRLVAILTQASDESELEIARNKLRANENAYATVTLAKQLNSTLRKEISKQWNEK